MKKEQRNCENSGGLPALLLLRRSKELKMDRVCWDRTVPEEIHCSSLASIYLLSLSSYPTPARKKLTELTSHQYHIKRIWHRSSSSCVFLTYLGHEYVINICLCLSLKSKRPSMLPKKNYFIFSHRTPDLALVAMNTGRMIGYGHP